MDVQPRTPINSVKVLRGIPFNNSYKDVMDFQNSSAQITYFTSKAKVTITNIPPVNIYKNAISLPYPAGYFYDCNYMMIQNAEVSQMWFYAFITNVEHVNNKCSIVHFEIDIYQTWQFKISLKQCFVEREHSISDNYGENLVSESVDLGYYRQEPAETTGLMKSYETVVVSSEGPSGPAEGAIQGGVYNGLSFLPFNTETAAGLTSLNNFLKAMTEANKQDAIVSIFAIPQAFFPTTELPVNKRMDARLVRDKIGSYTPKNKKLLCYPYNFLNVYTPDGSNTIYKYEYFQSNESCGFIMTLGMSCNPTIVLEPIAYQNQQFNVEESLTLGNFPQCAYTIDSFRAYVAQNATNVGITLLGQGASMLANPVAGALGMGSTLNGVVQASMKPPTARGQNDGVTFVATREKDFYFVNNHISEEYAKIIDDYFTMYGYATNRVKTPNQKGRPYWNYVKTRDAKIVGDIGLNDTTRLQEMYNSGVTIWHTEEIGDYSKNNKPV